MKHDNVDTLSLIGGLVMMVAGLFWFMSTVTVRTGLYRFGSVSAGLVVVPFLIGVVMLFFNLRSLWGRVLAVGGLVLILASVIMGTRLIFRPTSLFSYLLMLVLALGGAALAVKAIWGGKAS